jgi:hypothetical protein
VFLNKVLENPYNIKVQGCSVGTKQVFSDKLHAVRNIWSLHARTLSPSPLAVCHCQCLLLHYLPPTCWNDKIRLIIDSLDVTAINDKKERSPFSLTSRFRASSVSYFPTVSNRKSIGNMDYEPIFQNLNSQTRFLSVFLLLSARTNWTHLRTTFGTLLVLDWLYSEEPAHRKTYVITTQHKSTKKTFMSTAGFEHTSLYVWASIRANHHLDQGQPTFSSEVN